MGREVLFVFLAVLLIPCVFAEVRCMNDAEPISNQREIAEGDIKYINTLSIGVGGADENIYLQRIAALIIVDAMFITLNNFSSSVFEIYNSKYTFQLLNVSNDAIKMKINGATIEMDKWEYKKQGNLHLALVKVVPKDTTQKPNVVLMAGPISLILSNDEKNYQIISFRNTTYYIELLIATDTSAVVKVMRCDNTNITDVKKIEPPPPLKPIINDTSSQIKKNASVGSKKTRSDNIILKIIEFIKNLFRKKST